MNNYIAIGDIHGRYDLLESLLTQISMNPLQLSGHKLVFLGDMIDRGPDSFKVVQRIRELCESGHALALRGNHDDMMLDYYRDGVFKKHSVWTMNGGVHTMKSYVSTIDQSSIGYFFEAFEKSGHLEWLKSLPYYYETDKVWFSHAPVPSAEHRNLVMSFCGLPKNERDFRLDKDLLTWSCLSSSGPEGIWEHNHGKLAVCGHVHALFERNIKPRIYDNIIYADTGAGCAPYAPLTGIIINDGKFVDFIQAIPREI